MASGDLVGWQVAAAAFLGAVAGDQAGFALGRAGGSPLVARLRRHPRRAGVIAEAEAMIERHGGKGVFLTRWLMSPLGPYVNFLAGAARMITPASPWPGRRARRSGRPAMSGLGVAFADRIVALGQLLGNLSGFVAAVSVTVVLGVLLVRLARRRPRRQRLVDKV